MPACLKSSIFSCFLFLLSFCLLDHIIVAFPLVYYEFFKFAWRVAWDE